MTTNLNCKWTERTCAQNPHWSPDRYIQTTPGIIIIRLTGSPRVIARSLVFICCQPFCAKSLTGFYIHSDGSRVSIRQRPENRFLPCGWGYCQRLNPSPFWAAILGVRQDSNLHTHYAAHSLFLPLELHQFLLLCVYWL